MGGDPINFAIGNTFQTQVDFSVSGPGLPMRYVRYYNSRSSRNEYLGYGWTGSFSEALVSVGSGKIVLREADGKHVEFPADGDVFVSETGKVRTIRAVGDGHELTEPDGRVLSFDANGRLVQVEDRNGNRQTIGYDGTKPSFVSDDFGRRIDFGYDAAGKLETLTTPVGTFQYEYDGNDNLAQVTQPDGTTREYRYADPNDAHNLTGIVNEAGVEYVAYTYDDQDRAWHTAHIGGTDEILIDYADPVTRIVVDGEGNSTTYTLLIKEGIAQVYSSTGAGCGTCYASSGVGHEFTPRYQIRTIFDGEGHATRFGFDDRGNVIELTEAADTLETAEQILEGEEPSNAETKRTTTYTWHPDYSLMASVTRKSVDPAHAGEDVTTTYAYDANGNLDTVTETGYSNGVLETRVTDYDFDGLGRLTFVDGPRSGVADTFAVQYYPNEAAQGLNRGMPERIVNGLNQTTIFRDYNAFGKPERIVDANGVETLLTYDAAGRLVGQSRAGQATAYEYDPTGRLAHVYPPPGTGATRRIDYEYFDNGLLRKVSDSLGNYILYDYDANGNRTDEDVRDASGALTRYVDFQYDDFDRLAKTIYPDGAFEEFAYNGNHDPTSFRNGNGNVTAYGPYDALNRLTAATAPGGVATEYAYDGRDNPSAVTDPEDNVTAFVYNDFGELVSEASPDRGALAFAHDPAGNVVSRTDGNYVTATYGYDALNRLTSVSFPDSSQNLSYGYDAGTYGKGRLTSATDPAGSAGFVHDALGRVTSEDRVTEGVSYQTGYAYDPATGDLSGMTYPSGLTLNFQYDANGRVSGISSGGQPLVGNVAYKPFGPVKSMDLGPLALTRTYDQRYQVTGIQAGTVLNYGYTHDGAGNVETISGLPKPDFFPRLTDLTYNANRMATQNTDFISGIPIYSPAAVYAYDNAGNIVSDGLHTDYFYNQNNRLIRVEIDGFTVAEYAYDAFERRVLKVVNGVTTHFHYDLNGLLISETDGNGNPRKDYVYLNGEPVAMKVYGGSAGWYWFINDHLGTPQKMVDAVGNLVWAAAYAPFGEARVYKDEVVNNLRFPGQYYDVETGLHYNWHRYYDPGTGRYLRADPIGLDGGVNLYAYSNLNPINFYDPTGLWFGVDDAFTGPVDEILVIGGLAVMSVAGSDWAKEVLESLNGIIKEALTDETEKSDPCKDPCKGLREQLKAHQKKLKQYMNDPFSMDNKGFLKNSPPERYGQIYRGRIKNLVKQIKDYKKQLKECERANGI